MVPTVLENLGIYISSWKVLEFGGIWNFVLESPGHLATLSYHFSTLFNVSSYLETV